MGRVARGRGESESRLLVTRAKFGPCPLLEFTGLPQRRLGSRRPSIPQLLAGTVDQVVRPMQRALGTLSRILLLMTQA